MISTGNDIVALTCIHPERTKQKRFYSKVLSAREVELYNNKSSGESQFSFENFVWLAWSIKESVYKFCKRHDTALLFSPVKIIIQTINLPVTTEEACHSGEYESVSFDKEKCYCCAVSARGDIFYTRSLVYNDMIFTVANNNECFNNVYWGFKDIGVDDYAKQFKAVRDFIINRLRKILRDDEISIEKSASSYPFINQQKDIPLSFSHHGTFVGYVFATT